MKKSPLNFLGALVGAKNMRDTSRMKRRLRKVAKKVDVIDKTTQKIAANMPRNNIPGDNSSDTTMIGPGTNMPGATANESTDILGGDINNSGVVAGGSFDPSTLSTAENIFGKPMGDSFDRDLGIAGGEEDSTVGLDTEEDTNELV